MARDGEVYALSTEEFAVLEKLREARQCEKEWKEESGRARAALLDAVGSASKLYYGGNYVGDVEERTSKRFDRKAFKEDWPKLEREYTTESTATFITLIGDDAVEQA
jgi:hypothetical protein